MFTVTLDGPNGCGKSATAEEMVRILTMKGYKTLHERMPSAVTPGGKWLLEHKQDLVNLPPIIVQASFMAAWLEMSTYLREVRSQYDCCVMERGWLSTLSYGLASGVTFNNLYPIIAPWGGRSFLVLHASADILMGRLYKRASEGGSGTNGLEKKEAFLNKLVRIYKMLSNLLVSVKNIETVGMTIQSIAEEAVEKVEPYVLAFREDDTFYISELLDSWWTSPVELLRHLVATKLTTIANEE